MLCDFMLIVLCICFPRRILDVGLDGVLQEGHRDATVGAPGGRGRVGAKDRAPEIDASEIIADFQWHFPMGCSFLLDLV